MHIIKKISRRLERHLCPEFYNPVRWQLKLVSDGFCASEQPNKDFLAPEWHAGISVRNQIFLTDEIRVAHLVEFEALCRTKLKISW